MNISQLIRFLNKLEKLKCITRHSWTSSGRKESVAEHSWRLAVMIFLLRNELKGYDLERMLVMALFHDISEIKHGDIPAFDKTTDDIENEKIALLEISDEFEGLGIKSIVEIVKDFDEKRSKEAKVVNAIDKIEAVIQHNEADLSTWIEREYDLNLKYGADECEVEPVLDQLRKIIRTHTEEKISY